MQVKRVLWYQRCVIVQRGIARDTSPSQSLVAAVSPEARPMLLQNAAVHHDEDSRLARLLRGLLMNHILLQPDRRNLQLDSLIHDLFYELGPSKNVHDLNLL